MLKAIYATDTINTIKINDGKGLGLFLINVDKVVYIRVGAIVTIVMDDGTEIYTNDNELKKFREK